MMRNLVMGLFLANLLVLAWGQWIVPPDADDPLVFKSADEPELVLVERTQPRPARIEVISSEQTSNCYRLGPFKTADSADRVARRLSTEGIATESTAVSGQIWVGHWVQLTDQPNLAEARRVVAVLNRGGIKDAYIYNREPTIDISLGVFRSREGVDDVIRMARRLGFEVEATDRFRDGVEYWVQAELPAFGAPDLAELARAGVNPAETQIMRIEATACPRTVLAERGENGADSADSIESPPRDTDTPE